MQSYQLGYRVTTTGAPLNGGKAYFYLGGGTTTPADVYADDALTTPLAHPVVADSAGFFPEIVYLDPELEYRLVIKTSADVTIAAYSADPINTIEAAGGGIDGGDINENSIPDTAFVPGAIEAALGFTPQEDFTALTAHEKNVLLGRVGIAFDYLGSTPPAGAVKVNGGTIGSASSGASELAHADASLLFALLWALDALDSPILDSAGAGSTRGASAAADFAANKRLTLPPENGKFRRAWDDGVGFDSGRRLGSVQTDQVGPVTISAQRSTSAGSANDTGTPANIMTDDGSGTANTTFITATNTGSETRPDNVAYLSCIWY